ELQVQLHKRAVVKGAHSPLGFNFDDNRLVCVSGGYKVLTRYDPATGKEISSVRGDGKDAYALGFAANFRTIATAPIGKSNTVVRWDVLGNKKLATMSGHTGTVERLAFSHDGKTLASASHDGTVRLWDVPSGKDIATLKGQNFQWCLDFSSDDKML